MSIAVLLRSAKRLMRVAFSWGGCIHLCTLLILLLGAGCSDEAPPPGRILVKNDSQDREFNVISVLGGGAYAILKPGERFVLPAGTRTFTAQRKYKEYTRRYTVACPPITGSGITVKMIDMHTNRMPAGCRTVSASKQ